MRPYLKEKYGNAGTLYGLGREAYDAINLARNRVADMIGASPDQIIFTSGGTEANNMVFCITRELLSKSQKEFVLTSSVEHESVIKAAKQWGNCNWPVFSVHPSSGGVVRCKDVFDKIDYAATKGFNIGLISVMYTNNETGVQNEVEKIGRECRERGILFHTDCVQAVGCANVNVDRLDCDFLSISSHKIHGPKGVGALYVRNKNALTPMIFGGENQEFGLRGGTENVAGIVGFGKACELLSNNSEYYKKLQGVFMENILRSMDERGLSTKRFHVNGSLEYNSGKTLSMRFDGADAETLVLLADANGVCISAGSACKSRESKPSRVLTEIGLTAEEARSSIRMSLSSCNSEDDVIKGAEIIVGCVANLVQAVM